LCPHISRLIHIELIIMLTSGKLSTWAQVISTNLTVTGNMTTYSKQNISLPPKPLPISKPLLAGRESIAFASSASSLSNTGDPSPYKLLITQPYQLSEFFFLKQRSGRPNFKHVMRYKTMKVMMLANRQELLTHKH
jgi:hypothetical protein